MEVEEAVGRLRVVRGFRDQPLADDDVHAILEAGRRAGSSKNLQRWQFIVVRDRARLEQLAGAGRYARHLAGAAVAIALVTPDPRGPDASLSLLWDLGRAAQNMILVAWARGIGSAPATIYEHELCRSVLRYPQGQHCKYMISFGYPADAGDLTRPRRAGGRRPLSELVHEERW